MCTLILLDRMVPGLPLVVASNRDEYFSRPSATPARVAAEEEGGAAFVAPRDLEMGGTWMGLNARGVFVGLTNRSAVAVRADRRSRGLLVREALGRPAAREVAEDMRRGLEGRYNPFHLLCADGRQSFLTCLHENGSETRELEPGIHVVGNRDPADPGSGKIRRIREALEDVLPGPVSFPALFGLLAAVLRRHETEGGPLDAPCIHTPAYGTCSSAILAVGRGGWRYWHAEGPPCKTPYRDYSGLLDEIRQA